MSPPPQLGVAAAQPPSYPAASPPTVAEARSRAIDAQLRTIFQLAPVGIGLVDFEGRTILTNNALREMLGYSAEEFASVHFEQFTHPEDVQRNLELFERMAGGHLDRFEMDKRFFHRDGRTIWGRLTVSLLRDPDGQPDLAIGMVENVTEQRELQAQLEHAEHTFRTLVEQVPAVVYETGLDPRRPATYVSPQIEHLLGISPEKWLACPELWRQQISPEDRDVAFGPDRFDAARSVAGEVSTLHYRMRRVDGREIWVRDESRIETNAYGEQVLRGVLVEATREKQLESRLERLAYHDPLTLLANRELFCDRVDARMRGGDTAGSGAVLFIDLDDFKTVNDSLGHAAGDDLICSVAGRIQGCVRPGDLAGRLGGDEFAVLLEDLTRPSEALEVAERLRAALERPHQLRGRQVSASASIGVAYLADAGTTGAVLRNADLAMYRAKGLGKACVATYEPHLHRDALRRLELRSALGGALERGELFLQYQPLVDLGSAEMVGVEALLRWRHPDAGLIPPDAFVPLAEETGAIVPIGLWVLRQSTEWLAHNRKLGGRALSVSINVSPLQLAPRLVGEVEAALVGTGLPPNQLVIEVTEQALMSPRSWDVVRELKRLGVRIAIDDFGTGYSSLAYLSEFAVDLLKIDRSFIAGLTVDERSQAVPRAVVELARTLGLTVVAEGIETEEQWEQLVRMGCSVGQGYRFAKPVDPAELAGLSQGPLGR
ncbi:putative bifunctional diguanylate cyclase/phosphodiesterase [Egicoccus sp. AB-alg6-2]|uniref:putative bifunctional diguanylate cyclase/phosphodiesterase n=1 Tax=Egicoccus sp. AB-alg6-2 TaxID=3242692 RepID=UPI00359D432B